MAVTDVIYIEELKLLSNYEYFYYDNLGLITTMYIFDSQWIYMRVQRLIENIRPIGTIRSNKSK